MTAKAPANGNYTAAVRPPPGMIDAHAHHNSGVTCPLPLIYAQVKGGSLGVISPNQLRREYTEKVIGLVYSAGAKIQGLGTKEIGDYLVKLNTLMFWKRDSGMTYAGYERLYKIRKMKKKLLGERSPKELRADKKVEWPELKDWPELGGKTEEELWGELTAMEGRILNSGKGGAAPEFVPSLTIAPTMDMELAHIDGYESKFIYRQYGDKVYYNKRVSVEMSGGLKDISRERKPENIIEWEAEMAAKEGRELDEDDKLVFQKWKAQVEDTEAAAASNALRLLPLFFYDPRRYRYAPGRASEIHNLWPWDNPFGRIVTGPTHTKRGIADNEGAWIGFKMYPSLGHRPLDGECRYLLDFYKRCERDEIPILAHCSPGGMTTHDAKFYKDFDIKKGRLDERFKNLDGMDYFFRAYAHPENWLPALKECPGLHLCLAHFCGSEWGSESVTRWVKNDPSKGKLGDWIETVIDITRDYKNVYTDLSCQNIYNDNIRAALKKMLALANSGNSEFKHLKDKLIFGSDWYISYLTSMGGSARYEKYCDGFKALFYEVDRSGKLWERASLINPWRCYSLSKEKFKSFWEALGKVQRVNFNPDLYEKYGGEIEKLDEYVKGAR